MASLDQPLVQACLDSPEANVQREAEQHQAARAAKKRYSQSDKGRAVHRAAMRKYLSTQAGKEAAARATARYKAKKRSLASDI